MPDRAQSAKMARHKNRACLMGGERASAPACPTAATIDMLSSASRFPLQLSKLPQRSRRCGRAREKKEVWPRQDENGVPAISGPSTGVPPISTAQASCGGSPRHVLLSTRQISSSQGTKKILKLAAQSPSARTLPTDKKHRMRRRGGGG